MRDPNRARWRDAVHSALGSPIILPSMISKIEMAFETIEENWAAVGEEHYRDIESRDLIDAVLTELEKDVDVRYDRAKWEAARKRVIEAIKLKKLESEIPF